MTRWLDLLLLAAVALLVLVTISVFLPLVGWANLAAATAIVVAYELGRAWLRKTRAARQTPSH